MDFQQSDEDRAFRERVHTFFRENPPPGRGSARDDDSRAAGPNAYERVLADQGWLTMHWPREYGGQGASHMQQVIFKEEAFASGASGANSGTNMLGPTLLVHGTEEQRTTHIPRITHAEVTWCQGFSEPGAGSDLASLQTRAVREGDEYVINGQKIWTSNAHRADWIFMLVRTDPQAPKHRGISFLLVDMRTPGVSVRPLIQLTGRHGFNETFFEDVHVPVANRVGEENRGWYIATTTLDFERSGIQRVIEADFDQVRIERWWREQHDALASRDPGLSARRDRAAELRVAIEVSRLLAYRVAWMQGRGLVPNYEASMAKMYASDVGQWVARLGINLAGLYGGLYENEPRAPLGGALAFRYLNSLRLTIGQGTGEIQRNVIATRGLGLPRG